MNSCRSARARVRVRLIEHLDDRHDWEFADLRIAIRAHDRLVAA